MTNKEMLIKALNDEFDDGGATYDSVVDYNINCPYFGNDNRAHCHYNEPYQTLTHEQCLECKLEWLEAEVDE